MDEIRALQQQLMEARVKVQHGLFISRWLQVMYGGGFLIIIIV